MPWIHKDGKKFIEEQGFGFGLRAFKKFPELLPLVVSLSFASVMGIAMMAYSLYQKTDVVLLKSAPIEPFERVDPEQRQKLYTINQKYEAIAELEKLREEIGSYKR